MKKLIHRGQKNSKEDIEKEDVEKLVKELTEKPFIIGKTAIETESFRIWVFKKEW